MSAPSSRPKVEPPSVTLLQENNNNIDNSKAVTVLSFNVNYGNFLELNTQGGQAVLNSIRDIDADIVCLQESNANTEVMCRQQFCKYSGTASGTVPAQLLEFEDLKNMGSLYQSKATAMQVAAAGKNYSNDNSNSQQEQQQLLYSIDVNSSLYPNMIFYTDHMYYGAGIAVMTKAHWKLSQEHFYIPQVEGSYFPVLVVKCTHTVTGRELVIANVHLRPPLAFGHNSSIWDHLSAYLVKTNTVRKNEIDSVLQKCKPTIICGDFNEGVWGGAWNALRDKNITYSYEDAPYQFEGNKRTWFWPVVGQSIGAVGFYDHIFYSKNAAHKIQAVSSKVVDSKYVSDHYPVVAEFKLL